MSVRVYLDVALGVPPSLCEHKGRPLAHGYELRGRLVGAVESSVSTPWRGSRSWRGRRVRR